MLARSLGTSRARVSTRRAVGSVALAVLRICTVLVPVCCIVLSPSTSKANGPESLRRYGKVTWCSIQAMESPIGLPADGLDQAQDGKWSSRPFTSPSDIGAYLWSIVAAESLGELTPDAALAKASVTVKTLGRMKTDNGLFYNWYDPSSGEPLTEWPKNRAAIRLFVSSVDNAWLEVGLRIVGNRYPALRDECHRLTGRIAFRRFLPAKLVTQPDHAAQSGVFHVGYFADTGTLTSSRYAMLNSETRIIFYLALLKGEVEPDLYRQLWRTVPVNGGRQKAAPQATCPNGCAKCPGAYLYDGRRFVPSWGGSMFEALMVPLFVPEECWSPQSWGENHRRYVRAQLHFGLSTLNCGFWGFSPCMDPAGGYSEFGVPDLGASPKGYFTGSQGPVITPHASFLALRYERQAALENLSRLERSYPCLTENGFLDAINVKTGALSKSVLVLDQAMILAAIANDQANDAVRRSFVGPDAGRALKSMLKDDKFCFDTTSTPAPTVR